jgi:DNA helicase HerA-like ATPase
MAVGSYVTVQGGRDAFFGMITDIELRATTDAVQKLPPALEDDFLLEVYRGTAAYAVLRVSPMLRASDGADPKPVKTVPAHFSPVYVASADEVAGVFGADDDAHFPIGMPLDMDVEICLDYERFVERSSGVFGKSGTGKTFLTRLILAHLVQRAADQRDPAKRAVHLVFDMHNEYGWAGKSEGGSGQVKGLKQLLGGDVVVLTLDPDSSTRRNAKTDGEVTIRRAEIEPGDLAVLQETLNLTDHAVEAAYTLARRLGEEGWFKAVLDGGPAVEDAAQAAGVHSGSLENLRRGLGKLARNKDFLIDAPLPERGHDSLNTILNFLLGGRSVVLEFGKYGNDLAAYMLVANVLTRRIHAQYREKVEAALGATGDDVNHLVITIEEAHKFLNPRVAGQTIFGEIAREMRKYHVTLLIVDQRPSAIDDEVLSQVGTKVACLLDNEKDIDAVLAGTSGARELRAVLAKLETKQQALVLGHAVPMPVVVRTQEYGSPESYARFTSRRKARVAEADDLYG